MKLRKGFVSNSSSSSFTIKKENITVKQLDLIKNHGQYGEKFGIDYTDQEWTIIEDSDSISGSTWMDNFDMREYLKRIGVADEHVEFDSENYDWE